MADAVIDAILVSDDVMANFVEQHAHAQNKETWRGSPLVDKDNQPSAVRHANGRFENWSPEMADWIPIHTMSESRNIDRVPTSFMGKLIVSGICIDKAMGLVRKIRQIGYDESKVRIISKKGATRISGFVLSYSSSLRSPRSDAFFLLMIDEAGDVIDEASDVIDALARRAT